MKKLTISVFSLAAALLLMLSPVLALSAGGCCNGQCCGQVCCHHAQK